MRSRIGAGTTAALLLVVLMLAMLVYDGDVYLSGSTTPANLPDWPHAVIQISALAIMVIAVRTRPPRVPVGVCILAVTAAIALLGRLGVLAFYDGGGLALGLGVACLIALWMLATGVPRRRESPWDRVVLRVLTYVTLAVVLVPAGVGVGASISCSVENGEELCEIPGLVFGFPIAVLLWVATVIVGEVIAVRRRRPATGTPLEGPEAPG